MTQSNKKKKKKVLVIGATGGVGQATARLLVDKGWEVVASCRTAEQAKRLRDDGLCHQALRLSLDKPRSIDAAFARLARIDDGRLDAIVNCAAITEPLPLELSSMEAVQRTFGINVFGPLHLVQKALPALRRSHGRVVFVGSTAGSVAAPLLGSYNASKFALEALSDTLRRELAHTGVGISLVIPAGIKTPMTAHHFSQIDAAIRNAKSSVEQEYVPLYRQHRTLIGITDSTAVAPEKVAQSALKALTDPTPKSRYLCGLPSVAARTMRRFAPDQAFDYFFELLPGSGSAKT